MIYALLVPLAHVDDVSGAAALTLVFPLVLVFVVAGLWAFSLRRFRGGE